MSNATTISIVLYIVIMLAGVLMGFLAFKANRILGYIYTGLFLIGGTIGTMFFLFWLLVIQEIEEKIRDGTPEPPPKDPDAPPVGSTLRDQRSYTSRQLGPWVWVSPEFNVIRDADFSESVVVNLSPYDGTMVVWEKDDTLTILQSGQNPYRTTITDLPKLSLLQDGLTYSYDFLADEIHRSDGVVLSRSVDGFSGNPLLDLSRNYYYYSVDAERSVLYVQRGRGIFTIFRNQRFESTATARPYPNYVLIGLPGIIVLTDSTSGEITLRLDGADYPIRPAINRYGFNSSNYKWFANLQIDANNELLAPPSSLRLIGMDGTFIDVGDDLPNNTIIGKLTPTNEYVVGGRASQTTYVFKYNRNDSTLTTKSTINDREVTNTERRKLSGDGAANDPFTASIVPLTAYMNPERTKAVLLGNRIILTLEDGELTFTYDTDISGNLFQFDGQTYSPSTDTLLIGTDPTTFTSQIFLDHDDITEVLYSINSSHFIRTPSGTTDTEVVTDYEYLCDTSKGCSDGMRECPSCPVCGDEDKCYYACVEEGEDCPECSGCII